MTALSAEPDSPASQPTAEQSLEQARARAQAFRDTLAKEAKRGNDDALVDLATVVEQGDLVAPPDRAAALDIYEQAADKHNQIGREQICIAYLLGEGRPKNIAKASTYCDPLGIHDPVGLYWAGYAFEYGIGGTADQDSAAAVYSQAVDLGSGDAADALGRIAAQKQAPEAARKWYRRGVMLGSADAMDHLAVMVQSGEGGDADPEEAKWLFSYAAALGNAHAQAWTKEHPDFSIVAPLYLTTDSGKKIEFTRNYIANGKPAKDVMDYARITDLLNEYYPGMASYSGPVEGSATIDCYVSTHHEIEACVLREFPRAQGFGATLETFFSGKVAVSETDGDGQTTAQRRVYMTVNWLLSSR